MANTLTSTLLLLGVLFALANSSQTFVKSSDKSSAGILPNNNILVGSSVDGDNQVLNKTVGTISYKVGSPLNQNERRVWLVRVNNATGFSVGVFNLGFPESNNQHKLTITTFSTYGTAENAEIDQVGLYNFNDTSVLIVTLHTGNSSSASNFTGFQLQYNAYSEGGGSMVSSRYLDGFIDSTEMSVRSQHSDVGRPNTFLLHMFFYTWGNNTYDPSFRIKLSMSQGKKWTDSSRLNIYAYNTGTSWKLVSSNDYWNEITLTESDDMLFIAYKTSRPETTHEVNYYLGNFFCTE